MSKAEPNAKSASTPKTGFRATLAALAPANGIGAPSVRALLALAATALALLLVGPAVPSALAAPPEEPLTEAVTEITATTATFNGVLNPGASEERFTYLFFYSPFEGCSSYLTAPEYPYLEGEGSHKEVSVAVTGLSGSTTYEVCMFVYNPATGEAAFGPTVKFTTPASAPVVVSQSANAITPFAAGLSAEVNPENQTASSCFFEYGRSSVTDNKVPCEQLEFSGLFNQIASRNLNGLSPGSTYLYRVAMTNPTGETKGETKEFETPPAQAPSILSETAGTLTPTSARLEGLLDPHTQLTQCSFTYGLTVAENKVPCEPEFLEGSEQGVGFGVGGLSPNTTYHFRILAKNATGETLGTEAEFTTLALEAPIIEAANLTALTNISAKLEGQLNPDSQQTTYEFEYATDEAFTENVASVPGPSALPAVYQSLATGPVALGQLKPETTYYFRLVAINGSGTSKSAPQSFATPQGVPPLIVSESATEVTETGASFEAKINPRGYASTYSFQYATDEAFSENVGSVPGTGPLSGNEGLSTGPVALKNGLSAETVYYYRAIATNPVMGTTTGPTQQLKTLGKPVVTTGAAEAITRNTAEVKGTVNPKGGLTTYRVLYVSAADYQPGAAQCAEGYGCAYAQGSATAAKSLAATGYGPEPVESLGIEELMPATTYHYALVATNPAATTVGGDQTFTTAAASAPTATTGAASAIGPNSATIAATVDTAGLQTTMRFEVATAPTGPGQGTAQAAQVLSQSANTATIQAVFDQTLTPNTTYYYRALAINPDGISYGAERSFTTAPAPAAPAPAEEPAPSLAPKPGKCGKGKVRKNGKCVKKNSKRNSKKRANHNRRAGQ